MAAQLQPMDQNRTTITQQEGKLNAILPSIATTLGSGHVCAMSMSHLHQVVSMTCSKQNG